MRTLGILCGVLGMLASHTANACGLSTHTWIAREVDASISLPDLAALLADQSRDDWLANGAMFPDGGYSPIVNSNYGELAHWEPFQDRWIDHLAATYADICQDPDALDRASLVFGMAAHGIADQLFDGIYLRRAAEIDVDTWDPNGDFDTATDISLTAHVGPVALPQHDILPYDELIAVYAQIPFQVDRSTLSAGLASTRIAVTYTSNAGQNEDLVREAHQGWPWPTAHIADKSAAASPVDIPLAAAAYIEVLWYRLHDQIDLARDMVVYTWPAPNATSHPLSHSSVGSEISILMGRRLTAQAIQAHPIRVTGPHGDVDVQTDLFYRDGSNLLNVRPIQDWMPETTYTVTVPAGLTAQDGSVVPTDVQWSFSTGDGHDPSGDTITNPGGRIQIAGVDDRGLMCPHLGGPWHDTTDVTTDVTTDITETPPACGCNQQPSTPWAMYTSLCVLSLVAYRRRRTKNRHAA